MSTFLNHVNFSGNEARNLVIANLAADPGSPTEGRIYYNTTTKRLTIWNGTTWGLTATDSLLLNGQNAAFYLSRANHTGTQTASTISDLSTTVQAYRLDQFAVPTAALSLNSQRITNLADPVSAQDAATMGWVQTQVNNAAAGIDAKASVRLKTTGNDTLSGLAARDGVTPSAGDRVLVGSQTTASANGVYIAAAGAWTRATDGDNNNEMTPGAFWYVEEGTLYGKTQWRIENTGAIVVGTTAITINQFGGAAVSYTGSLGVQLVGQDFRAQVVASGGIQAVTGGLQVDTTIVTRKFATSIGNGSLTSIPVTHNLGTKDVQVSMRVNATDEWVMTSWVATDVNTVTFTFASAPASNAIRVVIQG